MDDQVHDRPQGPDDDGPQSRPGSMSAGQAAGSEPGRAAAAGASGAAAHGPAGPGPGEVSHTGPAGDHARPARRRGLTIPFEGFDAVELPMHRELFQHALAAGYTDLWSSETNGSDGLTPLALASVWAPDARLGSAILPVHTRGPALLAMSAAALAEAAPGRFVLGIGASSPAIVQRWNGIAFDQPFGRVRDTLRFLRRALAGQKVDEQFPTFTVRGFRLGRPPRVAPPILLAALRPAMIRLGVREGDGIITNWLGAGDVPQVVAEMRKAQQDAYRAGAAEVAGLSGAGELAGAGDGADRHAAFAPKELAARIFVCPTEDAEYARGLGRMMISGYLTVPAYAEFHRWLGRGDALGPMWDAWAAGDRKKANELIPDEVVDALLVHGTPDQCRAHVDRYADAGIDTAILALLPTPELGAVQAASKGEAQVRYLAEVISALAPTGE
ncbi:MAG TPA: LLM class flavin-dependent oxidoreductase [Actinocrinis sp.]|nr:LLM class flavin-dependent oxidoreductase [Actinocrinis sp.]